jgi:hypothetical protein
MKRVIAYIDGFNLYHGLRDKRWKRFYWLNLPALARRLIKPDQTLVVTKYFTTVVKSRKTSAAGRPSTWRPCKPCRISASSTANFSKTR